MLNSGQQDDSAGKSACCQRLPSEFDPWNLFKGGRREWIPENYPLTSACMPCDTPTTHHAGKHRH